VSLASRKPEPDDPEVPEGGPPPALAEVAAWVGMFMRTIKTCRLYDEANPTVVRFREDLASKLDQLLTRTGPLRLDVSPRAIRLAGHEVHAGHSREDNLAGVLYRDGIRGLSFDPGIQPREIDALLDRLLQVTGPSAGDDDLVTLLWDADLPHIAVDTVPLEGEADGGGEENEEAEAASAWPKQEDGTPQIRLVGPGEAAGTPRSDDWRTGEHTGNLEEAFDSLESAALFEIARFQAEAELEGRHGLVEATLGVMRDCLAGDVNDTDREELAAFLPRVLREALAGGDWTHAGVALELLRECRPGWAIHEFATGLCGPFAITTRKVVEALDRQEGEHFDTFLALAREMGPDAGQWLMHVLAESQKMRVRRPLARAIGELLAGKPEQIVPWLADSRWYVARNAVHILGWMGGDGIAAHLLLAAGHPEPRVRREVVAALSQAAPAASRPILLPMLRAAEPELFAALLQQLGMDPDVAITDCLLELLTEERMSQRTEEERRALFRALATRGDAALPRLEAALNQGGLFSSRPEPDRTAVALCIARIGTPAAIAVLERGMQSKRKDVRKACAIAGPASGGSHD